MENNKSLITFMMINMNAKNIFNYYITTYDSNLNIFEIVYYCAAMFNYEFYNIIASKKFDTYEMLNKIFTLDEKLKIIDITIHYERSYFIIYFFEAFNLEGYTSQSSLYDLMLLMEIQDIDCLKVCICHNIYNIGLVDMLALIFSKYLGNIPKFINPECFNYIISITKSPDYYNELKKYVKDIHVNNA